MKKLRLQINAIISLILLLLFAFSCEKSTKSLPRVVKNTERGLWEKNKENKVELNQTWVIGGSAETDQSKIFYMPKALALDSQKNIYVLDSRNNRI